MSARFASAARFFWFGQALLLIAHGFTDPGPVRAVEIRSALTCGALWLLLTIAARLTKSPA